MVKRKRKSRRPERKPVTRTWEDRAMRYLKLLQLDLEALLAGDSRCQELSERIQRGDYYAARKDFWDLVGKLTNPLLDALATQAQLNGIPGSDVFHVMTVQLRMEQQDRQIAYLEKLRPYIPDELESLSTLIPLLVAWDEAKLGIDKNVHLECLSQLEHLLSLALGKDVFIKRNPLEVCNNGQ